MTPHLDAEVKVARASKTVFTCGLRVEGLIQVSEGMVRLNIAQLMESAGVA